MNCGLDCAGGWVVLGFGVGVGVGEGDLVRLYFIWPNATEAANNNATVATVIRVIIKRSVLNLGLKSER